MDDETQSKEELVRFEKKGHVGPDFAEPAGKNATP